MSSPTTSAGRRRGMPKQLSTEDQALNMIAREAEARLAAKRAARAEARSIRMKELEKAQKEADEQMDREYELSAEDSTLKKRNIAASRLTSGLLPDDDRDVTDTVGIPESQLTQLKDNVRDLDAKYRKAMVNIAQLDNERQALQYQVECLKDQVEDMDETREDLKDELSHKTREYNKLSREHSNTLAELEQMRAVLQHREQLLEENGINLDGTRMERDEPDGGESADDSRHSISNHIDASIVENGFSSSEREKLMNEIHGLKEEIANLRADTEPSRDKAAQQDNLRPRAAGGEGVDIERSFVDVSDEAQAIQDESQPHSGLINNNERTEDYDVIDDGSQQGGIRNFEDMSFEKSGRSSLLSSMVTESVESSQVTDSVESEPLEISVNALDVKASAEQRGQDEYDIVHAAEPASFPKSSSNELSSPKQDLTQRSQALDINMLTARPHPERSPSPLPQEFNINKYFVSEEDDPEQESPVSTFSVERYFSTTYYAAPSDEDESGEETPTSKENDHADVFDVSIEVSASAADDSVARNSTVDDSVLDETIQDPYTGNADASSTDAEKHDEIAPGTTSDSSIPNVQKDIRIIATSAVPVVTTDSNENTAPISNVKPSSPPPPDLEIPDRDYDMSDVPISCIDSPEVENEPEHSPYISVAAEPPVSDAIETDSYQHAAYDDKAVDELDDPAAEVITDAELDALLGDDQFDDLEAEPVQDSDDGGSPQPVIIAAPAESSRQTSKDEETAEMRRNVEALYNQVAGAFQDDRLSSDGDTTGATFGVFAVTGQPQRSYSESGREAVFAVTGRSEDAERTDESVDQSEKKPKGWLVRVESFHTPDAQKQSAEIKVVEVDAEGTVSVPDLDDDQPVPKERKKKKGKKGKKGSIPNESQTGEHSSDAGNDSPAIIRSPSTREDEYRQVLGVENTTGESYSDYSDSEMGGENRGSKKGKKEGCKTQ